MLNAKNAKKSEMDIKNNKTSQQYTQEYFGYFNKLFNRAAASGGLSYVCSLLRVAGIEEKNWDAAVEAEEASLDFSKLLEAAGKKKQEKRTIRLGLLVYGHLTEMSMPYEVLANLLRCILGKPYAYYPFVDLVGVRGNGPLAKRILPSPSQKIEYLKKLCKESGETKMIEIFDSYFKNNIRNAFYHSDYVITKENFRIIEGSNFMDETPLTEVSDALAQCFGFYSAFFSAYKQAKLSFVEGKRYYRWPNYEVLELLSDKKEGLRGFKIHYSNGSYSYFERAPDLGTRGRNLMVEPEGLRLSSGDPSKLRDEWLVDGKPLIEEDARYNIPYHWKPIIFRGDSSRVQAETRKMTKDDRVWGCLFYIRCTGYNAVEFVIKSDRPLFSGNTLKKLRLQLERCITKKPDIYLYDGTVFLKNGGVDDVNRALKLIDNFVQKQKAKGIKVAHTLKYSVVSRLEPTKNTDGTFSIKMLMDDPRSTLVVSGLNVLPKSDWKIKEEWAGDYE